MYHLLTGASTSRTWRYRGRSFATGVAILGWLLLAVVLAAPEAVYWLQRAIMH